MVELTRQELEIFLHKFQKGKGLGLDGISIEFYTCCLGFIGDYLLSIVEKSRTFGHILTPFNSTFITLILKDENVDSFELYRLISLCNSIYKIISNIIALRLKDILSSNISLERFRLLSNRTNDESIGISKEGLHSNHSNH